MFKKRVIFILSLGLCALVSGNWSFYGGPWCAENLADVAVGMVSGSPVIYGVNKDYSLVKSTDEGQSWTVFLEDVDIRCVTCDPNNGNLVYIGRKSSDGGMMYSINGGNNWTQINSGLPVSFTPASIAMRDQDHIVLGLEPHSADHYSIYYWDVNQWRPAIMSGSQTGFRVTDLKWDSRPGYEWFIYASSDTVAQGGNPDYIGVYKSTNNGVNWSQIGHPNPGQPQGYMSRPEALSVDCGGNGYIYAGYRPHGGSHDDGGVMKTMDGGATWTRVLHKEWLPVTDVLGDPINPDKVYAAFGSGDYSYDGLGVYENMSGGEIALWHPINQGLTDLYTNVLITFEVNFQHFLYLGTDNSFYVRNLTTPTNWLERVKGMHTPKVIAVEPRIPNFFSFSDKANYASLDNGSSWSTRSTVAAVSENLSAEVHPSLNNEMLMWTKVFLPDKNYDLCHSNSGGFNWDPVYSEENDVIPPIPNIDYSYYSPERVYTFTNHANHQRYLLRSDNAGLTWTEYLTDLWAAKMMCVTCDRTPNSANHVFIAGPLLIHESTDGGETWIYKCHPLEFPWVEILFHPYSGTSLLAELEGPDFYITFTQTTDCGENWHDLSLFDATYYDPGFFTIDPEEPSLVYFAPLNFNTNYNEFYFSVDYCRVWIQGNNELPNTRIWDLEVDPNAAEYLYAGTDSGVYYYNPPFINKHLVSSSDLATAYNQAKKLVKVENEHWLCYESGGAVYAVHSIDFGETWSRKMEIAEGHYPAISMRTNVPGAPPGIVWRADGSQRDTIYFARYISGEKWTAPIPAVISDQGVDFSPPSFAIGTDNYGHLSYSDGTNAYYTQFYIYNPEPGIPEEIGSGENPSIGFMLPSPRTPEIHICWENNSTVFYRSRTLSGVWGDPVTVMGGIHPSIEIVGNAAHVVCENAGDIYRCYVYYRYGSPSWSRIERICCTLFPSVYPELTGSSACVWVEQLLDDYEIYFSYYDPEIGWVSPINISNTNECSNYPHITHRQTLGSTTVYFIWTEKDEPPYDIRFESYSFGGDEDLAFYVADAGEEDPSPHNFHRGGFTQYGSEPYKRIDLDCEYLEYQFEGLNPENEYALAAYAYQEGYNNLPITVKVDNIQIGGITLPPDTLIICKQMLPLELYTDSAVNIKIFGNDAVSAALAIYEYENDSSGGGGPQALGDLPLNFDSPIMRVFPNPVQKEINIQYTLFRETRVNLSIFDVAGRSVRNVISKNQISGTYHKSLSIANLPQGVYFIKLDTSDDAIVQKVIFIK